MSPTYTTLGVQYTASGLDGRNELCDWVYLAKYGTALVLSAGRYTTIQVL